MPACFARGWPPLKIRDCRSHGFGPPFPLKILIVVAAFWIFPPLGVAAPAYFLWRAARAGGGCAFGREAWGRGG